MVEIAHHNVTLASGAVAHYVACGPSGGSPVILLHGGLPGSSGWAGWRFMLPALGDVGLRVYAPDRPGFGDADTRPEHWPVRGFLSWAEFVEDFADALGLDRFCLGGNSQGTQTGAYVAVRNPDRIARMIMVACGGLNPVLDIPADQLTPGVPFPVWDGSEESMRSMLTTIVYRTSALDDDLIRTRNTAALRQREAFDAAAAYNRRAATDPNIRQALRLTGHLDELRIPTLYLYGRQDVLGPVANAYLQEDRLPHVQFLYPDECGHQGQTDQPELFNAVFTEFFTTGVLTRGTAERAGISRRRPEQPWAVASSR